MLASDLNNSQFVGARNPDDLLTVEFYVRTLDNEFESRKQGRPVKFDSTFIRIMVPGNQLLTIDRVMVESDKIRFPRQWMIFQNSQSQEQVIGTRLEDWPAIPRHRVEELKALRFMTVEQLANMNDAQKQRVGMDANSLQQMAQAFLMKAQGTADIQAKAAELAEKDARIKALEDQIALVMSKLEGSEVPRVPKKRGRPKKVKDEPSPNS